MPTVFQYKIYETTPLDALLKRYLVKETYNQDLGRVTYEELLGFQQDYAGADGRWREHYTPRTPQFEKIFEDMHNTADRVYEAPPEILVAFKLSSKPLQTKEQWLEKEKQRKLGLEGIKRLLEKRRKRGET